MLGLESSPFGNLNLISGNGTLLVGQNYQYCILHVVQNCARKMVITDTFGPAEMTLRHVQRVGQHWKRWGIENAPPVSCVL